MDLIVPLVLAPIGLFSGKPLAVGIALALIGSSLAIYAFASLVFARRFRRTFGGLAKGVARIRRGPGTPEEHLAVVDELFDKSLLASPWRQYRASVHFQDG